MRSLVRHSPRTYESLPPMLPPSATAGQNAGSRTETSIGAGRSAHGAPNSCTTPSSCTRSAPRSIRAKADSRARFAIDCRGRQLAASGAALPSVLGGV